MRLSHLSAAAVLVALVAAMFVSLGSATAQTTGISLGNCVAWDATNPNTMNYVAIGDSCAVTVLAADTSAADADSNADAGTSSNAAVVAAPKTGDAALTAISVGVTEVVIDRDPTSDGGVETYRITVIAKPTVIVHIMDSDNIVSSATPVPENFISIITRGFTTAQLPADGTTISVSTSGIYFDASTNTNPNETSFSSGVGGATDATTASNVTGRTFPVSRPIVIKAATNGTYKISATVAGQDDDGDADTVERKAVTGTATLTIGDPGTSPASVTLSLGNTMDDDPATVKDDTKRESGSKPATQTIKLVYSVSNSLGNPANDTDLTKLQVIAPKGELTPATLDLKAKGSFEVGSSGQKAQPVTVRIIAVGAGGAPESKTITLTFTGGAGSIELGDASGSLLNENQAEDKRDEITFSFMTKDSASNAIKNRQNLAVVITDPSGTAISVGTSENPGRINWAQGDAPGSASGSNNQITLTSNGSPASRLATGEYMLKITSGTLSTSASFTVAGKATSVEVALDNAAPSEFGEIIKATATISDSDGNPVANGTMVTFSVSSGNVQGNILSRVGVQGAVSTRGGMASAHFAAVGNGTAVITAVADGATGVVVATSTAGAPEADDAMAEEEASVSCLSSLSGFSTWSCGVETSASEIFGLVSGRGATAVHLWNGSAWVRYSVVDGTEVPGSSDFMVAENDILYISN